MLKLDMGNVLLKPSHRRQLMAWLKRPLRMGERFGDFVLTLSLHRIGRSYEVRAAVRGAAGEFGCRRRQRDWRHAIRDIAWTLDGRLHALALQRAM